MVEGRRAGQALVQPVAKTSRDQGRLGRHAQLLQQRQQQHGLALAVAELPGPGLVGLGRDIAAVVHPQEEIAGLGFHQGQGREGPRARILVLRGDGLGLGAKLGLGLQGLRLRVERRHAGGNLGPGLEARHLHLGEAAEPQGRAGRGLGRLHARQVQVERLAAIGLGDLGRIDTCGGEPAHGQALRPGHLDPIATHQAGDREPFEIVGPAHHGIAVDPGIGHLDQVAGLQALDLPRHREATVQRGALQIGLSPQHRHVLAVLQEVDGLAAPQDAQGVDGELILVRAPGEGLRLEAAQALGLQHLEDPAIVLGVAVVAQPALVVVQHHLHGRCAVGGGRFGDRRHIDPGRGRTEGRLVGRRGRPGQQRQDGASRREYPPIPHANPPTPHSPPRIEPRAEKETAGRPSMFAAGASPFGETRL